MVRDSGRMPSRSAKRRPSPIDLPQELLDLAPVSLWVADFSDVKRRTDQLRAGGVVDFEKHLDKRPQEVLSLIGTIRVVWMNDVTPSLFGFRDRREFPENLLEAFGKASYKLLKEALVAFAEGRTEFIREVGGRSPQGQDRHLLLHAKLDSSDTHGLARVCVAITDITPIKGAEEDLKRSEATYRQAFERAVVPMLLVDVGTEIILDASSAFQQMLGTSYEALQGAHLGQCFPASRRERCVEDLGKMLQGKQPIVDTLFLSHRDGTEVRVSAKSHAVSAGNHPCAVVSFSPAAAAVSPWERRAKVDRRASSTLRRKLSDRERLILSLITTGLTNKAIAERLSISRKTVETHRQRIMQKLDIHKATDLVRLALTSGILAED